MTDDRSLERAVRSWIEPGPTEAPDHAVDAALLRIQTTNQDRDWHVPWRTRTMTQTTRLLAGAAAIAVVLVGGVVLLRPGAGSTVAGPTPSVPAPSRAAAASAAPASPTQSTAVSRLGNLTKPFASPLYGYRIMIDPTWMVTPATKPRNDPLSLETFADEIQVTGTDSMIGVSASRLGNRTWDKLLAQLRANATGKVPPGCEGGDAPSWPTTPIGDQVGRIQQLCNAAIVYVLSGNTVYEFDWGNTTFDSGKHLSETEFLEVLRGVAFRG